MGLRELIFGNQWELVAENVIETFVHRRFHEYTGREAYRTEQEWYVDKYRRQKRNGILEYKIVKRNAMSAVRTIYPWPADGEEPE